MSEKKEVMKSGHGKKKQGGNWISIVAPVVCVVLGYIIWRFILGSADGFNKPDPEGGFWPHHMEPKTALNRVYEGGIIVPLLIGLFLMVIVFSIERFITLMAAKGKGNNGEFVKKVQYLLANKEIDEAISLCDKQKGSVANVMRSGLLKYKEMSTDSSGLTMEQKKAGIRAAVEEATALELPMLQKNLVFLSTITSLGTLVALMGTVLGMIKSFSALGSEGGGAGAAQLAVGISEALYNTLLGISTSALALALYNVFTTWIDGLTYNIDETGFTLEETFQSLYK